MLGRNNNTIPSIVGPREVVRSQHLNLSCTVQSGVPVRFAWLHSSSFVDTSANRSLITHRNSNSSLTWNLTARPFVIISGTRNLTKRTRMNDAGTYVCEVTYDDNTTVSSESFRVVIQGNWPFLFKVWFTFGFISYWIWRRKFL